MALTCTCRAVPVMAGAQARSYALRYLRELSSGDGRSRLMLCRACGAFWELSDDDMAGGDAGRRLRLRRVRSAAGIEDWRLHESDSDDRD